MVPPMSLPGYRLLLATVLAAGLTLVQPAVQAPAYAADSKNSAAADFLSVADDVPLMPGLREKTDTATVFDKPEGRIVQTTAQESQPGKLARQAVLAFYGQTLPQLGWQAASATRFTREREALTLTLENQGGVLIVHFEIAPAK